MAIVDGPAPAEICYVGTWAIKLNEADSAHFELHYPAGFSNISGATGLSSLGLTRESLAGARHTLRFEVRREAGTFVCAGDAGDGEAAGTFRFDPNAEWINEVRGMGPHCPLSHQVIAAMGDVSVAYVRDMRRAGYRSNSLQGLFSLKMRGIAVEQAQTLWADFPEADWFSIITLAGRRGVSDPHALHEAFPDASIDEIVTLAMSDATPDFVARLRLAGVRTPHNFIRG